MRTSLSRAALLCCAAFFLAFTLTACDQADLNTSTDGSTLTAHAKPGGKGGGGSTSSVPDSHVEIVVTGTAGIRGVGDAYIGGQEGVRALIAYHDASQSRTGGLQFSPQQDGRTRTLSFDIIATDPEDGWSWSGEAAPYITVAGLMQVGADATDGWILEGNSESRAGARSNPYSAGTATFQTTGIPECTTLRFENLRIERIGSGSGSQLFYPEGSDTIKWVRDENSLGAWTIETVDGSKATCTWTVRGSKTDSRQVSVPLHFTVNELLPAP